MTQVLEINIDISKGIEQLNSDIAAKEQEFYDCNKKITLNDIILIVFVELASLALPYTSSSPDIGQAKSILYNTKQKLAALKVNLIEKPVGEDTIKSYIRDFLKIWKTALLSIDYNDIGEDIKTAVEIVFDLVKDAKSNLCEVIDVSDIRLENVRLTHQLEAANKTTAELSEKIEEMHKLTTQIEVIKSAQEKIGADKAKLEEKSQQIADQLAKTKLANELNSIIFSLQSKVLETELAKKNESNTGDKKTIEKLKAELNTLVAENKKNIEDKSKSSDEYTETLEKLKKENNLLVQKLESGELNIQKLTNDAEKQQISLDKLTKENERIKAEIEGKKQDLEANLLLAEQTAKKIIEDTERALESSKKLSDEEIEKLNLELNNARNKISELTTLSIDVETTNIRAKNQLDELKQKISMAESTLLAQETTCTDEKEELSKKVSTLEVELENVKNENFSLHEQNTRLNGNQNTIYAERLIKIQTIEENEKKIAELERDIRKLTSDIIFDYQKRKDKTIELIKALKKHKETIDSNRLSEGIKSIYQELMTKPTPDNIKPLGIKINRIYDYALKKTYSFKKEDEEDDDSIDDIIGPAQKEPPPPPSRAKTITGGPPPRPSVLGIQSPPPGIQSPPPPPQKVGGGSIRYMEFQKLSNNNILYIVWVLVAFITLALSVYVSQFVMQRLEKKEYKHPIDKSVTFSLILTFVYSCIFVLHSLLGQSSCLLAVSLSVCGVSGLSLYLSHVFSVY